LQGDTENTIFIIIIFLTGTAFYTGIVSNLNGYPAINNIRYF